MQITLGSNSFSTLQGLVDHIVENYKHLCKSEKSNLFFDKFIKMLVIAGEEISDDLLQKVVNINLEILTANNNDDIDPIVSSMLLLLITANKTSSKEELTNYLTAAEQLRIIPSEFITKWSNLLVVLRDNSHSDEHSLLLQVAANLGKCSEPKLIELLQMFNFRPYPTLADFASELQKDLEDISIYISQFDRDPHGQRLPGTSSGGTPISRQQKIDEQFSSEQLRQIIKEIQNLDEENRLSLDQQSDLVQQHVYLHAIGKDQALRVGTETYKGLVEQSRATLSQLSYSLISTLRKSDISDEVKLQTKLKLLAVMRELYFRASGQLITSRDLTTILFMMQNPKSNRLAELATAEEQTTAIIFIAAMQWVVAGGASIDVCLTKQDHIPKQFNRTAINDFYKSLEIPFSVLSSGPEQESYKTDGINFSNASRLSESSSTTKSVANRLPAQLIMLETDFSTADYNSISGHDLLDYYSEYGTVIGITGPVSSEEKLTDQCARLNMKPACRIHQDAQNPKKKSDKAGISAAELNIVHQQISNANQGQPIVLIAKDENQAELLARTLYAQLNLDHSPYTINLSSSVKSEALRQKWMREEAGKSNVITILTPELARGREYATEHPSGFLAIQTTLDKPTNTMKVLDGLALKGKPGQYVAIYEQGNETRSRSWSFQTNEEKKNVINELKKIQNQLNEDQAIQQYLIQAVTNTNHVVMKQFEDWKAFLHMILPQSDWTLLDLELSKHGDELIKSLATAWTNSGLHGKPAASVIKRNQDGKLDPLSFEGALKEYELMAGKIWEAKLKVFQDIAQTHIKADSINDLRFKYLSRVSFPEQLNLHKVIVRQQKQKLQKETKANIRYLESAFDVNGAMLRFSDSSMSNEFREPFIRKQIRLLENDIIEQIRNATLSTIKKQSLIKRIQDSESLYSLVLALNDFAAEFLTKSNYAEKYRLQPIIREILRTHRLAGLANDVELDKLKGLYLDNVLTDIVSDLENSLSWAQPGNRGLGYWLERSAVNDAANDVLATIAEINQVKKYTDAQSRKEAFKKLYLVLETHQKKLEDLWIFSLGHKNTRTLINQTLRTLNELTAINSEQELEAGFVQEYRAESQFKTAQYEFNQLLSKLEVQHGGALGSTPDWARIKREIEQTQQNEKSVFVWDEIQFILGSELAKLPETSADLVSVLKQLRAQATVIKGQFEENQTDVAQRATYLNEQAEQIKNNLLRVNHFPIASVKVNESVEYKGAFDLMITGTFETPILKDFVHYQSRIPELTKELDRFNKLLKATQVQKQSIDAQKTILADLKLIGYSFPVDLKLFSESNQIKINEIRQLRAYIQENAMPENLAAFPDAVQKQFQDRQLMQTLKLESLTLEQINQLNDGQLKDDMTLLFNKMQDRIDKNQAAWYSYSGIKNLWNNTFSLQETEDDWREQLYHMANQTHLQLRDYLVPEIATKCDKMCDDLSDVQSDLSQRESTLEAQILFLKDSLSEEQRKPKVVFKRFDSLDALYQFKTAISHSTVLNPQRIDAQTATSLVIDSPGIQNQMRRLL